MGNFSKDVEVSIREDMVREDEQGRKIFQQNGNGVWTTYAYDPQRQWLNHLYTELPSGDALQNLQYNYDPVGNIMDIDQSASAPVGTKLGGPYDNHYIYDQQYRLEQSNGGGDFPYTLRAGYSPAGRLGNKSTSAQSLKSDLLFGYDQQHMTHQPRTMYDPNVGTLEFFWDANGNLAQMIGRKQNSGRLHEWDEENRLRFVLGEKYAGYYGYDANGERVYKLTGISNLGQVNSGSTKAKRFLMMRCSILIRIWSLAKQVIPSTIMQVQNDWLQSLAPAVLTI